MNHNILITYASRYGSTAEIAERIGEVLSTKGHKAKVAEVREIHDLKEYTAVVIGSAVYVGRWRKDAIRFIKVHEKNLSEKDVWIFSTGPTGTGDPVKLLEGWKMPKALEPVIDRIRPKDITVFHGAVDPEKLSGLHRFMVKKVDAPVGDFRDWQAIEEWAGKISESLGP